MTADNSLIVNRNLRPYAGPDNNVLVVREETGLKPSDRTETHLKRYLEREKGRHRVSNLDRITSRARIGNIGR